MVVAMRRMRAFHSKANDAAWCTGAHDAPCDMLLWAKARDHNRGEYILPWPVMRKRDGFWYNANQDTRLEVTVTAWRMVG